MRRSDSRGSLRMLKAFTHPLRVEILARLDEEVLSPKELAHELGTSLPVVSYHVRELERLKMIELVRVAQRRGAVQHWYRAKAGAALGREMLALDEDGFDELARLLEDVRGRVAEISGAAQARLAAGDQQPLHATFSLMLFEGPYGPSRRATTRQLR